MLLCFNTVKRCTQIVCADETNRTGHALCEVIMATAMITVRVQSSLALLVSKNSLVKLAQLAQSALPTPG